MKKTDQKTITLGRATGVSFCGSNTVTCGGRTFTPDADLAYVEFKLSFGFPVTITERTGIHPQVIANSFRSLENKVFNLNHTMRSYDPQNNLRDYILGSVVAVEFPEMPEGGWIISSREAAPSIRAVASMFKAAQQVEKILEDWAEGRTPLGAGDWTVSMENSHKLSDCGFLVRGVNVPDEFVKATPADLVALGFTYVPVLVAPLGLLQCLNTEEDDLRQKNVCTRVCRDYLEQETFLLIGGLDGRIRYNGVALTPLGKEPAAHVSRMFASDVQLLDTDALLAPLHALADAFLKK